MAELIYVVLADGFEEIEAAVPIDILRRAGFNVVIAGLAGNLTEKQVRGSHGITITADKEFDEVSEKVPDVLVLPGGMPGSENLGKHGKLKELAEKVLKSSGYLAAICAAPALTLAAWGLLEGKKAVCFPGSEAAYLDKADWQNDIAAKSGTVGDSIVVDGHFITGRGPGVALEFSFAVVETLRGKEAAAKLKKQMQFVG
jgi:4-methyl-5(b-hydroxyethyl)-thiazole monophosphate biosynthesis